MRAVSDEDEILANEDERRRKMRDGRWGGRWDERWKKDGENSR